jgi:uncharacterized protein (DUF1778 family)
LPEEEIVMLDYAGKRLTTRVADHVVVQAALEKANKVIENESSIVLTRRESQRLLEMLENPPSRNEKFLQAQARYWKMKNDAGSAVR